MAFNEIYTLWRLETSSEQATLEERFEALAALARTLALRSCLAQLLSLHGGDLSESVEIYLYYETKLRERLGLDTAIQHMAYSTIGKREWIDEERLVESVRELSPSILVDLDAVCRMAEDADIYAGNNGLVEIDERWEALELALEAGDIDEGEYTQQGRDLSQQREQAKRHVRREWVNSTFPQITKSI